MDTSHWSQLQGNNNNNIGSVKPILEEGSSGCSRSLIERRTRPQKDQALNCPRCNSTNTKFCYYNNYSLSQPRFICKTCKRYWTEGGSLRNVPVGGGSRKNKRSPTSPSPSNSSKKLIASSFFPQLSSSDHQNPKIEQGQDLNLAYPPTEDNDNNNNNFESFSRLVEVPNYENTLGSTSSSTNNSSHVSAMELFKSAGIGSRGLMTSFMPMGSNNEIFSSGLIPNLEEFKPNLNFGVDGFESGYGVAVHDNICSNARLLFPTNEDHLKQQVSSTSTTTTEFANDQQNRGQGGNFAGYWNGMLGGGSW